MIDKYYIYKRIHTHLFNSIVTILIHSIYITFFEPNCEKPKDFKGQLKNILFKIACQGV